MLRRAVRVWLHGLGSAVVGGVASGITVAIVDPNHFNLSHAGLIAIAKVSALMGLWSAGLYLKQSPIPPLEDE